MTAKIYELRPATATPEELSVADQLRQLAAQLESGAVASASVIVTDRDGRVSTINAPVFNSEIAGLRR